MSQPMRIDPPRGTRIRFMNQNGTEEDREYASAFLNTDDIYGVEYTEIGGWSTKVHLMGFPDVSFNSVMFTEVEENCSPPIPLPNPNKQGLNYWADKPLDRIIDKSHDPVLDECRGILLGFKATLDARNGHLDMITRHQAVEEIKDLIRKCGGDPEKYQA